MLEALKTHVSLHEAFEIEAIKCMAGDARHDFQEWYSTYRERTQKSGSKSTPEVAEVDSAVVAEELQEAHEAIAAHEQLLTGHRLAVVAGKSSPLSDADVDATYATIESLRANLPVLEALAQGEEL